MVDTEVTPAPTEAGEESSTSTAAVCWICAEPVRFWAMGECNHRTCHVCALRLRALYKKMECTFCKARFVRCTCAALTPRSSRRPR